MERHRPQYWITNNGHAYHTDRHGYDNYQTNAPLDQGYYQAYDPYYHTYHREQNNYPVHWNYGYQAYQGNKFHTSYPTGNIQYHADLEQVQTRQQHQRQQPSKKVQPKPTKPKKRLSGGSQTYSRQGPNPEQREKQRQAQLLKNKKLNTPVKSVLDKKLTLGDFIKDDPKNASQKCEKMREGCCGNIVQNRAGDNDKGNIEVNNLEQIETPLEIKSIQCETVTLSFVSLKKFEYENEEFNGAGAFEIEKELNGTEVINIVEEFNDTESIDIVQTDKEYDISEDDMLHYGITMCCFN